LSEAAQRNAPGPLSGGEIFLSPNPAIAEAVDEIDEIKR